MSASQEQDHLPDLSPSGFVMSGGMTEFSAKISPENKTDILNSLLYAQLSANEKSKRDDDPVQWYLNYVHFLKKIGFDIQDVDFDNSSKHNEKVSIGDTVIHNLSDVTDPAAVAAIKSSIDALRSMSVNDKTLKQFYSNSQSTSKGGNFQVNHVDDMPDGKLSILLTMFYFRTVTNTEHSLNYTFDTEDTKVYKRVQKAIIDPNDYSDFRVFVKDYIRKRLEVEAMNLVTSIKFH